MCYIRILQIFCRGRIFKRFRRSSEDSSDEGLPPLIEGSANPYIKSLVDDLVKEKGDRTFGEMVPTEYQIRVFSITKLGFETRGAGGWYLQIK